MSEQTLFTNEQLLSLLEDWNYDMGINEPSVVHAAIVRTINDLRRAIDQATVEQLMPTILEGLPNLNRNDFPYSLPDDLEDAFGINQWTDRTWGEHLEDMGYIEYPIHAPMNDTIRKLGKDAEFFELHLAFHRLFPVERFNEIRQWARKVYGWDCDIDVSIEICRELTWDGLSDEEVTDAWGYLYVGPHVPRKRDLPSQKQQNMLQCADPVLPMGMELAPYGDENSFLEWLVYGFGEWICESETGNIADHKAEIEYIKAWWLAMTGTRMENICISSDCWEERDGVRFYGFMFDINHDDIRAVYGHLELPQCEVDKIIQWAERHQWTDMEQYLGWFGKTIEDEPVEFGPSNVDVHQSAEEPPPVADCPVESIMDQIQDLSEDQLDMLLERIESSYTRIDWSKMRVAGFNL